MEFPTRVPGAMLLTDVFLHTDKLLDGKLFPKEPKDLYAGKEATRVKKCIGALRYLYRNSNSVVKLITPFNFFFDAFFWEKDTHHSSESCIYS